VYGQVHLKEKIPEHVRNKVDKEGETIRLTKVDQAMHAAMAKSLETGKIFEVKYDPNKDKQKAGIESIRDGMKKKEDKQDKNDKEDRERTQKEKQAYEAIERQAYKEAYKKKMPTKKRN